MGQTGLPEPTEVGLTTPLSMLGLQTPPSQTLILTLGLFLTSPPSSHDRAGQLTSTLDNATACSPVSSQNYVPHLFPRALARRSPVSPSPGGLGFPHRLGEGKGGL